MNELVDLDYREATLDDMVALEALEQKVVTAERPFNTMIKDNDAKYYDLHALITGERSLLLVGEHNQSIVATGYVDIRPSKQSLRHEQHGYLGFMFVDDSFRGKGINQQLMKQLMAWAEKQNVYEFYLDVYDQNQAAIRAYEKLGFSRSLVQMQLSIRK